MYNDVQLFAQELQRRARGIMPNGKPVKRDFQVSTDEDTMNFNTRGETSALLLRPINEFFPLNDYAHRQIGERTGIPAAYYDRMRKENPMLLDQNVNSWLQREPKKVMLRVLDGQARAILSDRYRPLDNEDMWSAVAPALFDNHAIFRHAELTMRKMYIKATFAALQTPTKRGDVVEYGLVISNSEVGAGAWNIEEMLWTLSCSNGAIAGSLLRRAHIGRAYDTSDFSVSDRTRLMEDAALVSRTRDIVKGVLTPENFQRHVLKIEAAEERKFAGSIEKGCVELANRFRLTEGERERVQHNFIEGQDLSAWGLSSAVTLAAQAAEDYDRRVELEKVGHSLIELPKNDWQAIAEVAA